jgi:hypothetical protein
VPAPVGLKRPAAEAHGDGRRRLGALGQDRLGSHEPLLALRDAPAVDQRLGEVHVGDADERVRRPAHAVGDRDRLAEQLLGAGGAVRHQAHDAERGEAGDLDVRAADAAPDRQAALQVGLGVRQAQRPGLGDAQVHERERPQLRADRGLIPGDDRGGAVDDGAEVAESPGAEELRGGERGLGPVPAALRQLAEGALRGREPGVGLRPARLGEEIGRGDRRHLRVGVHEPGRQSGEQRGQRRLLAVEDQLHPVAAEQLRGQLAVAAAPRVADRVDRVPVLGQPDRGGAVEASHLAGRLAPELEP